MANAEPQNIKDHVSIMVELKRIRSSYKKINQIIRRKFSDDPKLVEMAQKEFGNETLRFLDIRIKLQNKFDDLTDIDPSTFLGQLDQPYFNLELISVYELGDGIHVNIPK